MKEIPAPSPKPTARQAWIASEFTTVLSRERSRADRLGDEFTLILIRADKRHRVPVDQILECLDCTEELGWLPDGWLAVLFPHTSAQAALETIRSRYSFLIDQPHLTFRYLTCPTDSNPIVIDAAALGMTGVENTVSETPVRRRRSTTSVGFGGTVLSLLSAIGNLVFPR